MSTFFQPSTTQEPEEPKKRSDWLGQRLGRAMRYGPAEKLQIIRLVEESDLSVRRTLAELGICRSTFYRWYRTYWDQGYEGLAPQKPHGRRFWNRIPEAEKQQVVEVALQKPELTPRQLACHITDHQGWFISESSV